MNSWLAFLLTLSLIILVHEWGHFVLARVIGVKVERFSFGFGPLLLRWTRNGTEYALSLLPFGGYVKLAGESDEGQNAAAKRWEYRSRSVGERASIVLAGPLINYVLGFLLFLVVFLAGAPVFTARIGAILKGFPAESAGLQVGDRVLSVNGKPVDSWEEMTLKIQAQTGPITLSIERNGTTFPQVVQPKVLERTNLFGRKVTTSVVGITPSDEVRVLRYSPLEAIGKAARQVWFLTQATMQSLWKIVVRESSFKESFTGPIGIFHITSAVAQQGISPLLYLIAVLSTSIGFFNLLPIPVLDGGHLLFLVLEKIRGKSVSLRAQEAMTRVGLGLLLLLLVTVTYNDFLRFNIGGKLMQLFGRSG